MMSTPRSRRMAAGLAGVAALLLTACGSSDSDTAASDTPAASPAVDAELAAKVPAAIKADGVLTVGTDTTYAPMDFLDEDGSTVVGIDMDILDAAAAKLGLKTEYKPAPFDAIISGIQGKKYEIGASAFTINDERKQVVNMVSYFRAGTQWAVAKGNPKKVDADAACGLVVAVQKGTVQVEDITARSKACTDAGKKAITIDQYQGQDQATASVVSGKSDAMLADSPITAYATTQTGGKLETLGDIYDSAPYGWVVAKDQTDFADALLGAMKAIEADGSYGKALAKWGVEGAAISDFAVNP